MRFEPYIMASNNHCRTNEQKGNTIEII